MKGLIFSLLLFITCFASSAQELDYDVLEKEFRADTARVEEDYRNSTDYTTIGMIEALNKREEGYDKLLNKYYKILMDNLGTKGKAALKATQRNWLKLRDSDKDLVSALHTEVYDKMGGGTIWGVVSAGARTDITRRRVIELYNYLMFSDVGGR